ncbi:DNA cytosine methyltransferase [Buttiauxella sp. 3AFRM03]|nr:DNA cytosine methyltransferase [Buttiauxella sp. 3AFRM03]
MNASGERTVRGWESGEHIPSDTKWRELLLLEEQMNSTIADAPFKQKTLEACDFTFIDLFAGIGGIRLPFQKLGGHCVFTSEWDKFAQKTYFANFGEMPHGDITKISASEIPEHDILLGGFPCQAFSQAGLKQGFSDTRGTMFFEIQRILAEKRPKAFLLENVKQLQGHDKGNTLKSILDILRGENKQEIPSEIPMSLEARNALSKQLNYWVDYRVLRAADFGIPQNRERIFIIGFDKDYFKDVDFSSLFKWPVAPKSKTRLGSILHNQDELQKILHSINKDAYTISDKLWVGHQKRKEEHKNKGNGFGYSLFNENSEYTNTISARYYKDGSEILIDQSLLGKNPRKLTPRECARLQGFPESYIVDSVSHGQIYKQFGNSVCVKVIDAVAEQLISTLKNAEDKLSRNAEKRQMA